jgi:hypothetical protein
MEDFTHALRSQENNLLRLPIRLLILTLIAGTHPSWASSDLALSMVPRGRVIEVHGREFLVKTASGSKVNIEFHRNGSLQEASGKNLNQGDDLEPGDGLISLSTAARGVKMASPRGYWTLENDQVLGWIYEFDLGIVDARTGKLLVRKKITTNP